MKLYCPLNLDIHEKLSAPKYKRWQRHIWKFQYVLTVVYHGRWNKAFSVDGFVRLHTATLRKVISPDATEVKNILVELQILETDNVYIIGEKSKAYRFLEPYASAEFRVVEADSKWSTVGLDYIESSPLRFVKKTGREQDFLFDTLTRTTIEADAARAFVDGLTLNGFQRDYYRRSIEFIENKEWFFCADPRTGRIFNDITSLPKVLRSFLRIDGQPFIELDIANCQPLLLADLYDGEAEADRYKETVEAGKFYEEINVVRKTPFSTDDRDQLKKSVLTVIFDDIREKKTKTGEAFASQFPILYEKIQAAKKDDYTAVALKLQKTEAELMINGVVGHIARGEAFPALTIHDSILTLPQYKTAVEKLITDAFRRKLNLTPTIRVK